MTLINNLLYHDSNEKSGRKDPRNIQRLYIMV